MLPCPQRDVQVAGRMSVMPSLTSFTFNAYSERCHLLGERGGACVIVDPGCQTDAEVVELCSEIARREYTPAAVLLTHAHFDHIYGVGECIRRYGVPVYMGEHELRVKEWAPAFARMAHMPEPDVSWTPRLVGDGQTILAGGMTFEVIWTPGHSEGGVCWLDRRDKLLFSGDTLFAGAIGRSDLPYGDYDQLILSLMNKLMALDGNVTVCPGHGPDTTIGYERARNPFLQPFNGKDEETGAVDGIEFDG